MVGQYSFFISVFTLIGVFIVGCSDGRGEKPPRVIKNNKTVYEYGNENEAYLKSRRWTVNCESEDECPNTVAQLVVVAGRQVSVCTASLISNDLAITNSHCFEVGSKSPPIQQLCNKGAILVFASNSAKGREVVECESVIVKSKIQTGKKQNFYNPDYMILKLKKRLNRGFDPLETTGLQDGLKLQVRKVDPYEQGGGLLIVRTCEVYHSTYLVPSARSPQSPVHIVGGCPITGGNSGASLLDSKGRIRGLIFATLNPERLETMTQFLTQESLKHVKDVGPSYVTNGACIMNSQQHDLPEACFRGLTETEQMQALKDSPNQTYSPKAIDLQAAEFKGDIRFGYNLSEPKVEKSQHKLAAYLLPKCYNPESIKTTPTERSVEIPILKWSGEFGLDKRLRYGFWLEKEALVCRYHLGQPNPQTGLILAQTSDLACQMNEGPVSSNIQPLSSCKQTSGE